MSKCEDCGGSMHDPGFESCDALDAIRECRDRLKKQLDQLRMDHNFDAITLAEQCERNSAMQQALGFEITDGMDADPVKLCERIVAERDGLRERVNELEEALKECEHLASIRRGWCVDSEADKSQIAAHARNALTKRPIGST